MFRVLIVDDNQEDRELLKMEIQRALASEETDLKFFEAPSIAQAKKLLNSNLFDLMTLDIEFDRLSEGIEALPDFFESYPTLNIIVVSGKLNKAEVSSQLFQFTKDNFLKGKRWARHFDVLDKKDKKDEAILSAHAFAAKHGEVAAKLKDLFLMAESYLEQDMVDKCLEVYQRIQHLAPGEAESAENLRVISNAGSLEGALEHFHRGETLVASLLVGHYVETRLRRFTKRHLGRTYPALSDCVKELARQKRISTSKEEAFHHLIQLRNKAIHHPDTMEEEDFLRAGRRLDVLDPGGA